MAVACVFIAYSAILFVVIFNDFWYFINEKQN